MAADSTEKKELPTKDNYRQALISASITGGLAFAVASVGGFVGTAFAVTTGVIAFVVLAVLSLGYAFVSGKTE